MNKGLHWWSFRVCTSPGGTRSNQWSTFILFYLGIVDLFPLGKQQSEVPSGNGSFYGHWKVATFDWFFFSTFKERAASPDLRRFQDPFWLTTRTINIRVPIIWNHPKRNSFKHDQQVFWLSDSVHKIGLNWRLSFTSTEMATEKCQWVSGNYLIKLNSSRA